MKVLKERINRHGRREVTVELHEGDKLMSFNENRYYRLGGQVEDVVQGHVITESDHVMWCSVAQRWEA
jgi:hypothetical protein